MWSVPKGNVHSATHYENNAKTACTIYAFVIQIEY